ncbi:hypothetical protein [Sodalis sp. (in: enterobacteria)]|uniref:hypothetical protein n=1 Tax=Sodalis sp. (in: enterobacteria) TaxID=1898979 RepID=UPI003F3ACB7E
MIALVRFLLLALLSRVPAAVSARLLARISRHPLRLALGWLLQPLLTLAAGHLARYVTPAAAGRGTASGRPFRRR